MRAIQVKQAGGVEQLVIQECPVPLCKPDEVLVQIKVAGINYIDVYIRKGLYNPPYYPFIPGKEGSGIVIEVGNNVKDIKKSDRVAFCVGGSGTYAEFAALPAHQVIPIPDDLSFEIAAAAMLQGLTAYYLSHKTILLNENHHILIHAGAGGVGLLLIQMAKMLGAKVMVTVSTEEKAKLVKTAGADEIVLYTQESFLIKVMEWTHHQGVNVVYDAVGKTTFEDSLKSLAIRGMLVSYGQSSGFIAPIQLSQLAEKSLYLTRPNLGHYTQSNVESIEMTTELFEMIISNHLKILVGQRYPLAEAATAHADLEARKTIGKSVLMI